MENVSNYLIKVVSIWVYMLSSEHFCICLKFIIKVGAGEEKEEEEIKFLHNLLSLQFLTDLSKTPLNYSSRIYKNTYYVLKLYYYCKRSVGMT